LELSGSKAALVEFPLSPLSEQQRIVDRIESLFSQLEEAKEKAQAVVDGFELRKSAILHQAFTGELTEQWRREHGVGVESWKRHSLIDILVEKPRNGYSPKPVAYETPYKSMTLSATTSGVFMPEYFKYVDEKISDDSYLWLKPGDILMQRANSLEKVGTSALYTGGEHEFIYPDLMMKLQVKEGNLPEFIAYQLKTEKVLIYLRSNATGTAGNMPKINQKVVSSVPIMIASMDEQREIVRILDALLSKEQQAKDTAEAVLDQIDTMKKAILARAFRGKLGTNDPSEENAVELLKAVL
jgi:type I restriction enzyme S subunit